jgi:hypothetical protein
MIRSEAFSCLNDSFGTIQMVEWFIQDHSVAWMIQSGPFSCLNDSFRLLNKNRTFPQQLACCWITSMYCFSTNYNYCKLLSVEKLFRGIHLLEWFIQDHSGLEWFIQDHSVAWMIHSGPFRCFEWFIQGHVSKRVIPNIVDLAGPRNAYDPY